MCDSYKCFEVEVLAVGMTCCFVSDRPFSAFLPFLYRL